MEVFSRLGPDRCLGMGFLDAAEVGSLHFLCGYGLLLLQFPDCENLSLLYGHDFEISAKQSLNNKNAGLEQSFYSRVRAFRWREKVRLSMVVEF